MVKNPPANAGDMRDRVRSLRWEGPLEEGTATHSSVLAGESHGQRGLVGYSPWGRKESDTTVLAHKERLAPRPLTSPRLPDLSKAAGGHATSGSTKMRSVPGPDYSGT